MYILDALNYISRKDFKKDFGMEMCMYFGEWSILWGVLSCLLVWWGVLWKLTCAPDRFIWLMIDEREPPPL